HPYVEVQLFSSLKKQGLETIWGRLNTFFGYVD
ncbi:MAG TPA: YihA family ribosome biogenesis GTP-binding protein, partial [Gammaproteobacteria bacterium]|nr:YihA family ribosome biogenesis GTP-binding protein [Gammaproteobacteria bacterium]